MTALRALLLGLVLALPAALPAAAPEPAPVDDTAPFADAALEGRFRALTRELRCLVCQNETIADSHAELAVDLRREIRVMLEAGRSDREILAFMTDRYGQFVLYRPPFSTVTLVLWTGPLLLLAAGAVLLRRRLRRVERAEAPSLDESARRRVERWLRESR